MFTSVAYDCNFSGEVWSVKPVVAYRHYLNFASQFDFLVVGTWQQKVWLQVGYRTLSGMIFSGGIDISRFGFAYSYELASSVMSHVSSGSNEIGLYCRFGKTKDR